MTIQRHNTHLPPSAPMIRYQRYSTPKNLVAQYGLFMTIALLVNATQGAKPIPDESIEASRKKNVLRKFELDIQPILTARGCNAGACHGKARGQNGFALSLLGFDANMDYQAIVLESRSRRLTIAEPKASLLLVKATGQVPHGGGVRFTETDDDYRLLLEWIQTGMARTSSADPQLDRIEISPAPHSLAPDETETLTVTATYNDGSSRDVTRMCAFQTNEPAIISAGADGILKAGKITGEATIMARYMGKIATWSTAIPQPEAISADRYAGLARSNFIDELVIKKLSSLNIFPSEPCNDAQFVRRLYFDAIGRIPTADEVRAFLDDSDPEKRARWVAKVLDRPEYADYWANKWADLLRPNPYRVGIKATYSLDAWLREAFRKNLPYDQFVFRLVTAQGSTWRNGAVTLFRDRRQPEEITTMVCQLFLGVRLECAKCHQHPFEVYGQSDFYGMAAHFARVGYKGTGISPPISGGEEIVYVKSKGEVRHPLTDQVLAPRTLFGEAKAIESDQDPRVSLAHWMTSADNPYFANVAVNRLWADVMGVGIVDPVDDLRATNPASNQPLLAALADYFKSVQYDNKKFLTTLFTSQTYALSSVPNESNASDARNFSRHYRKRLRAEILADAISDITERNQEFESMPKDMRAMQLWTLRTDSEFLDAFGRPDENQDPPCERETSVTMTQTLHLMNASHIQQRIASDEGRCHKLASSEKTPEAIIEELYLTIYNRFPQSREMEDLKLEFDGPSVDRRQLVEDLMWSMLNAPEFLYLD